MATFAATPFERNGRTLVIRETNIAYFATAERFRASLFYTKWEIRLPKELGGILARVRGIAPPPATIHDPRALPPLKEVVRLVDTRSAAAVLANLDPNRFEMINRGVVVNLDYVIGFEDLRQNRPVVLLEIDGVVEGVGMSGDGARRLYRALTLRSAKPPSPGDGHGGGHEAALELR